MDDVCADNLNFLDRVCTNNLNCLDGLLMTRLQLENLAAQWLNDPNKTFFTASTLQTRLNLAQMSLQTTLVDAYKDFYTKCATTTLVVNQGDYSLPDDFRKIRQVALITQGSGDTATKIYLQPMDLTQQDQLPNGNGMPAFYYLKKNNLYLRQVPSQALTMHIEYIYRVPDMASDSDEPDIPEEYHEFLAILAVRADLVQDGVDMSAILELKKDYEEKIRIDIETRVPDGGRMVTATRQGYGSL